MSDNNIKSSHEIFFKYITPKKLDEFLKRSDKVSRYLQKQITEKLKLEDSSYFSNVFTENKVQGPSIYIYFKKNDVKLNGENFVKEIGHISLHLSTNKDTFKARLHARNGSNLDIVHYLQVTPRNNNNSSIQFSLTHRPFPKIKEELEVCVQITLDIINSYFDKNSENHLSKSKINSKTFKNNKHSLIKPIQNNFTKKHKTLSNTRSKHKLKKY